MTTESQKPPRCERETGLGYGDVARIAEESARRGLRFANAETVEPYSDYWIMHLRAADGTLHRIDSWARWRALQDVMEAAR
jgi:hypothetical protein